MKVIYVNGQAYAEGTANNVRVHAMKTAMEAGGISVELMQHPDYISEKWHRLIARFPRISHLLRWRVFATGTAVPEWMAGVAKPDVVVLYGSDYRFLKPLERWCRKNDVPFVNEIVDWYRADDAATVAERYMSLRNGAPMMRLIRRRSSGLIVASSFLKTRLSAGQPSLVIAAAMEAEPLADSEIDRSDPADAVHPLRIGYAGSMNGRDRQTVANLVTIAASHVEFARPVHFDVYGWSGDDVVDGAVTLRFHGRQDRKEVIAGLVRCDFTVLQRDPEAWFAKAGFPSKVAESLSMGIPVIGNITSDLGEHLVHGKNAVIVGDISSRSLEKGISEAIELVESGALMDRSWVRRDAEEKFGTSGNAPRLREFFQKVTGDF